MKSGKLTKILSIISEKLSQQQIPFCLIGAMALGIYGLPRFTSDIDLLTEGKDWPIISEIMEKLGYTCFQKSETFAQFDSELGVLGKIDFMFVNTRDGKELIKKSIILDDQLLHKIPVIQPTDYIILKLMAIANNPERSLQDEADIANVINLYNQNLVTQLFDPLDKDKILAFAGKFGQQKIFEKYFEAIKSSKSENITL